MKNFKTFSDVEAELANQFHPVKEAALGAVQVASFATEVVTMVVEANEEEINAAIENTREFCVKSLAWGAVAAVHAIALTYTAFIYAVVYGAKCYRTGQTVRGWVDKTPSTNEMAAIAKEAADTAVDKAKSMAVEGLARVVISLSEAASEVSVKSIARDCGRIWGECLALQARMNNFVAKCEA